jgi:hypothetical protein
MKRQPHFKHKLGLVLAIGAAAIIASGSSFAGALAHNAGASGTKASSAPMTAPQRPVLVELFTSQGCSSCPPADKVAARLVKDDGLVVISRPVTYWDRLGWKDTLARSENTDLQRAYARRTLQGRNGVYTPQIVVDGRRGAVGSRLPEVRQMIRQEAGGPAALAVRSVSDGSAVVGIAGEASGTAELVLIALDSEESVRIGSGENGGRLVTYTNVVKAEEQLGTWNGETRAVKIAADKLSRAGSDRYAVVLREQNAGQILAAHYLPRS